MGTICIRASQLADPYCQYLLKCGNTTKNDKYGQAR